MHGRDPTNWGTRGTSELLGSSAAGGGDSLGEGSSRNAFNGKSPHAAACCMPHAMCCVPGRDPVGQEASGTACAQGIWAAEVSLQMSVGRRFPGLG